MAVNTALAKNFEFKNIQDNWLGYVSSRDPSNLPQNVYVQGSLNMYKKINGNLSVRPGQKRMGVANDTFSPISSEFVWNTSWGATYTAVIADSKLSIVVDSVWYTLQSSLTLTRYVFDKWWNASLAKDQLLFVNGTSSMMMWSGGFALIASTTANTIVLDRTITASFLTASGTVIINGTTYTYTGSSGSTLTGVTANPTGEANGSGVLAPVVTTANAPAAGFNSDFLKVINNQVYVGSYLSRLCYISANDNYIDYTVPTPRSAGDPELLTLDSALRGIGVRTGKAHIGIGNGEWAIVSFTDITVGTVLTQQTVVDVKPVANLAAPYAHEFIDNVGDNLVYLSQDQQIRTFGDFNNVFVSAYPSLSQEISTELMAENFEGGSLKCIADFTYLCSAASGKTYLYQVRQSVDANNQVVVERLWHAPFIWSVTHVDDIEGTVVGFSNANPQIYELWDTNQWHDDSPSDEPLPYSCVLALSYRTGNRRQGLQSFDKLFSEGYFTAGTPLNGTINYNYKGATNSLVFVINSIQQPGFNFSTSYASLGDSSLGDEPEGDGITEDPTALVKFKVIKSLPQVDCFEYQPVFSSDAVDAQWELLAEGTNAVASDHDATFIINKLRNS